MTEKGKEQVELSKRLPGDDTHVIAPGMNFFIGGLRHYDT